MSFKSISKSDGQLIIKNLIKKFDSNYNYYTKNNSKYNESQTRSDFIDPFFEALDWDLHNKKNLPNYAREVILEDSTENESTHNNPDYGFQAGTQKKFFVEAKKPSVKIENNSKTAFQSRSYGWTDKHPISILTNFEYLIFFDTTIKPNNYDNSKIARISIYHYKDYTQKFDEIHALLSRNSIFSGSFDKKVSKLLTKSPTVKPDSYFLSQLNKWRKKLAKNLLKNDPTLDDLQINDLIQKFLNRIIFLRICEDRTLEKQQSLLFSVKSKKEKDLLTLLQKAESKYDSELFDSSIISPLKLDSSNPEILEIIEDLYYPKSPFSFRVIESSLLGDVYEQFLTEKIKSSGKAPNLKIFLEKKPEHENRDVISTPTFTIRKIVEDTLSAKCDGLSPEEIQKLKILDPCCGSGTFLIEAFQFLVDYVIEWYKVKNDLTKIYQVTSGWRLNLSEKIKLVECLHGIDIDFNAIEATKFSICTKLMENESGSTISTMNKILPKLDENFVCGNTVVDDTIWTIISRSSLTQLEINKTNVLDWKNVFTNISGFDVIVGNPPYMQTKDMKKYINPQWRFFKKKYSVAVVGQFDEYYVFIQKSLELLADNGQLGFIVPHKFMKIKSGKKLRELLSKNNCVRKIIDFGTQQIFEDRTTYTCMLFLKKGGSNVS